MKLRCSTRVLLFQESDCWVGRTLEYKLKGTGPTPRQALNDLFVKLVSHDPLDYVFAESDLWMRWAESADAENVGDYRFTVHDTTVYFEFVRLYTPGRPESPRIK